MNVKVNGYNWITSQKNGKDYTVVHCNTDIPFSNGEGSQNLQFMIEGHKKLVVGEIYEAVMGQTIFNGQVQSRVVDLQ